MISDSKLLARHQPKLQDYGHGGSVLHHCLFTSQLSPIQIYTDVQRHMGVNNLPRDNQMRMETIQTWLTGGLFRNARELFS